MTQRDSAASPAARSMTDAAAAGTILGLEAGRGRWLLLAHGMVINLCLGAVYSWSVFVKPLTDHFTGTLGQTMTAGQALLPFSIFLAAFAIAMPLTGRFIESWGPRRVAIIGGGLTGLGWLLSSFAGSVTSLCLLYGLLGGAGVGITYGAPVAVAARWFPDRRGLAVGLTVLGFGFSAFLTANVAGRVIDAHGVMSTFRIFGLAFVVLITLLALPLRFPAPGWAPRGWAPRVGGGAGAAGREMTRAQMVRRPEFLALWACFFIGCLAGLMAISISKPVGMEVVAVETGLATALVGVFAVFNGGGRPLFGALADWLTPQKAAVISFVLIGAAALLMWVAPSVPAYVLAFAVLWGCLGGWLTIAPTATASYFGTSDYARCYGVVFLAYGAGGLSGPQLAGLIRTTTGSYLGVFPWVLALAAVGLAIAATRMRPARAVS